MTNPTAMGEVLRLRSRNAKHFLLSDGRYQAVIGMQDVHFLDDAGKWQDVNRSLFDEGDFDSLEDAGTSVAAHAKDVFKAKAAEVRDLKKQGKLDRGKTDWRTLQVAHETILPKNIKKGYSIGYGADRLTFVPVGASPSRGQVSQTDSSTAEYPDVWPMTDVHLTVTASGLKETLVVKGAGGPAVYSTEVQGELADDLTCGSLRVRTAWLEDAAGTRRDVPTVRAERNGKVYVDIVPAYTGLVFPVRIDPTTTFSIGAGADDGAVKRVGGSYPPTGTITASSTGYPGPERYYNSDTFEYTVAVGLMRWDTSALPDAAVISGAQLSAFVENASSSGGTYYSHGAWYEHNGIDSSDWTDATSGTAWSNKAISTFTAGATNTISLSNTGTAVINKSGYTGIRLTVSGPTPTATIAGGVSFGRSEDGRGAQLLVMYTTPPGAPVVTSPNGGETWNAQHTITWTAATDADTAQASLQYQVQLSTDNGSSWSDIVALTTVGATSYSYDFSAVAESATCLIRIRAYDGTSYGAYDQSDAVFTISHTAPGYHMMI